MEGLRSPSPYHPWLHYWLDSFSHKIFPLSFTVLIAYWSYTLFTLRCHIIPRFWKSCLLCETWSPSSYLPVSVQMAALKQTENAVCSSINRWRHIRIRNLFLAIAHHSSQFHKRTGEFCSMISVTRTLNVCRSIQASRVARRGLGGLSCPGRDRSAKLYILYVILLYVFRVGGGEIGTVPRRQLCSLRHWVAV